MKSFYKISLIVILLFTITGSTLYISDKTKTRLSEKKESFLKRQAELDKYYSDKKLGSFVENGKTIFRLFTPNAEKVTLVIFNKAEDEKGKEYEMTRDENAVWETELEGELYGKFYGFNVMHKGKDAVLCIDPYAKAVASLNDYFTPRKSIVVKESDYDWEGR
jgi:1,4-alpha-glucan branching enzyme